MTDGIRAALVVAALATIGPPALPKASTVQTLGALRSMPSPAAEGALAPQLAVSPEGAVYLSWLEPREGGGHRFRFAERQGARWSEARTIHEGDALFANWADVPALFAGSGNLLVAHWLQQVPGGKYAYGIRTRSSSDGGRTWSPELVPHRDTSPTEHGFLSFVDWPSGGVGLVWLDGRQTQPGGHDGGHGAGGAMSLRSTTLQPPSRLGEDVLIDDRVCDCCPTAATRSGDAVLVAYRDRGEREIRDIYVARHEKGRWTTGRAVHDDGWKIAACPVNGPALAADGKRVVLAWFTAAGDKPRVLIAFSSDGGATFRPPVQVNDAETLGRVDVEWLPDGRALVLWLESEGEQMEVRARPVSASGHAGPPQTVARVPGTRTSGYPRVARAGSELVFAWRTAEPAPGIATAIATLR